MSDKLLVIHDGSGSMFTHEMSRVTHLEVTTNSGMMTCVIYRTDQPEPTRVVSVVKVDVVPRGRWS